MDTTKLRKTDKKFENIILKREDNKSCSFCVQLSLYFLYVLYNIRAFVINDDLDETIHVVNIIWFGQIL